MKILHMPKMQSCCIQGCDSYKQSTAKNIAYFKFPLHDSFLLKKWLQQINRSNWKPSETSQICSVHFKEKSLKRHGINKNQPLLLPTSVPTIFLMQKKARKKRKLSEEIVELRNSGLKNESAVKIKGFEPHRNKVSLLRKKSTVSLIQAEEKSGIESKLRNISTKVNTVNGVERISSNSSSCQKPFLRITINKKLNVPTSSKPIPFETVFLPCHGENGVIPGIVKAENEACVAQRDANHRPNRSIHYHSTHSKHTMTNLSRDQAKPLVKQYTNKLKPQQIHTQFDHKTVSQDHMYSCSSMVKMKSVKTKTRQESDQLRRRLEELREKRKREQLKIVRLQMHLIELEKKMKENNQEEIVLPNLGQGNKPARTKSNWLIREKEEYEKLLKDVREIKLKVLRERHNRELEKIRALQIQMTNLRKKMSENDEKEIALSNLKETNNSSVIRPDWMKREEEEYEKLLQDVRKIKQSYKLRETNKQDSVKSDLTQIRNCEKVLNNEDSALIEIMQNGSKLMEEIEEKDTLMYKVDVDAKTFVDNYEYGEVIGEIDENSIDIDISNDVRMVNFNEELSDPGLLDS